MDAVFDSVGAFGKYQRFILAIIGGISALVAMNFYGTIFMTAEPPLICHQLTNDDPSNKNQTILEPLNNTCEAWELMKTNKTYKDQYTCMYDQTYYGKTIINDWNLICDRKYLASLTQTIFMVGTISGMTSGVISDRYGRKIANIIFICLLASTLVLSQLMLLDVFNFCNTTKYIIYSINQFLSGIFVNCLYCTAYVLLLELTTGDYHTIVSNVNLYLYVVGELIVLISYYLTRDWYSLYWVIAIYSMVFVAITIAVLPESPRWLVSQNRYDEALKILNRISLINGKEKIDTSFNQFVNQISEKIEKLEKSPEDGLEEVHSTHYIFKNIFCSKSNFLKIYLLIYIWIAISLLYYGVSLGITSIDFLDPYLIYLISSLVEIVGLSLCYLNDKIGRKKALFSYLMIASISSFLVAMIPQESDKKFALTWKLFIKITLALTGKLMVSAAFNTCYMFTAELYTTSVRNTVILFLTCIGGLGSLVSPQINLLRSLIWEPLPYIIYSASSFLACFALLFLPETHVHQHL